MTRLLMVLGLVAVAGGVSGCFFESGSGPAPTDCASARFVSFDWEIVKNVNNAPLTCDQANGATIVLDLGGMKADFVCPIGAGVGRAVSPSGINSGTYATFLQLLDPNGQVLSDTSVGVGTRAVTVPQCASVHLGVVTFGTP